MMYVLLGIIAILVLLYFKSPLKGGGNIEEIPVSQAKLMLKEKDVIALDVRTPAEVAQGKIPQSINLNVTGAGFVDGLSKLDPSKRYVVYCRSGKRSMMACKLMKSKGFDQVYNMEGGFNAYR